MLWVLVVGGSPGCPQNESGEPSDPAPARTPSPEERELLYALGGWLARNLAGVKLHESDIAPIQEGLADALLGRPLRVQPGDVGTQVQKFLGDRRAELAADEKRLAAPILAAARQQPGAQRTFSGLVYLSLAEGEGASPTLGDSVRIHHEGTLRDGTLFDSSAERGPAVFELTGVIPCWTEALQRMRPGGRARLACPSDLAYGDRGLPGRILPGAMLRFDIELLEVLPDPRANQTPAAPGGS